MAQEKNTSSKIKKPGADGPKPQRELIVIARREAELRAHSAGVASASGSDLAPLEKLLKAEGAILKPLFGLDESRIQSLSAELPEGGAEFGAEMSTYYHVEAADDRLDELAESFQKLDSIEGAYVKPPGEAPVAIQDEEEPSINDMQPVGAEAPAATPDFSRRQIYLDPAPVGIDARFAWTRSGGRGQGIKIIDCEWGWNLSHEDLTRNTMGVIGTNSTNNNHGTAVLGEYSGDRNAFGITGISPDATAGASSFVGVPSAETIRQAADRLGPGDIILLEIHRPGPRSTGSGQQGFIAVEWWPDDYAAIRYAVAKGIIVVEAAGNGGQNFDDPIYDRRPNGFPASWRNPYNPANPSSGAVMVGAGAPPPGTHGRSHGPDRSRLGFSNYGRRVDCQGWGREVTSTGYGDLQGGARNRWYTDTFSGTSSASPIIVGALACTQGILKTQGGKLLTSSKAITLLRATGSPQQDATGRPRTQRIGNRPDLRQLIPLATNGWQNNKRVIRTHAKNGSKQAWAILDGSGWIRLKPQSADGVTNTFIILSTALANNRRVDVFIQDGQIQQATLR